VPSVLVWMGVVVANGPVVASTVFGIVLALGLLANLETVRNVKSMLLLGNK
jgi:hypothetical protein